MSVPRAGPVVVFSSSHFTVKLEMAWVRGQGGHTSASPPPLTAGGQRSRYLVEDVVNADAQREGQQLRCVSEAVLRDKGAAILTALRQEPGWVGGSWCALGPRSAPQLTSKRMASAKASRSPVQPRSSRMPTSSGCMFRSPPSSTTSAAFEVCLWGQGWLSCPALSCPAPDWSDWDLPSAPQPYS